MSLFKRLSVIAVTLVVGVLSTGGTVGALSSGGIGGRPANPDSDNPRSQSIFIFTAGKSEVKRDTILVSNSSDEEQTIELYAVDGIVTNTGAYTCSQMSEVKQGMGGWIAVDKSIVTLGAGKTEKVGFSLTIPDTADVGEHNGCLVFQLQGDQGQASGNVRIVTRQAIRVVATIPGDLHRNIDIQSFTMVPKDNKQLFNLDLQNTGNVSADVDAKVYLTSLFGGVAYQNGGGYPVLADQKLNLSFVNEKQPFFGGWYYVQAKISYDKRAGSFGVGEASNAITKTSARQLIFVTPTMGGRAVILFGALSLSVVLAWYMLRRRARMAMLSHAGSRKVKSGETIESIAGHYGVSWKKLASSNKLRAPYVLTPGSIIRVPPKPTRRVVKK